MKRINQIEPWIGKEEKDAVVDYLESGGWLTEFKKTKELEQMISDYTGSKYSIMMPNGTIALTAAILALGIGKGDEVIVPNYTMIASANAVVMAGAKPILVDIDPANLCLDLSKAKKAFTKKTKAIMLVTINGRYPDIKKFKSFAKSKNIYLIEDAAQSLGSMCNGKHLGTFGDVGMLSFSMPKIITMGQGGCLLTDNEELHKKILLLKDFGRKSAGVDTHEVMGYNFKFNDLQAVIGIEQMKKLPWRVERKKEIFKKYKNLLAKVNGVEFFETNTKDTSPWFIDILVPEDKKESLIKFLQEKNIGTRPFYPAIHTQNPYKKNKGDYKNSEKISRRGLWLPSSAFLSDEDIVYVCNNIKEFFHENTLHSSKT